MENGDSDYEGQSLFEKKWTIIRIVPLITYLPATLRIFFDVDGQT